MGTEFMIYLDTHVILYNCASCNWFEHPGHKRQRDQKTLSVCSLVTPLAGSRLSSLVFLSSALLPLVVVSQSLSEIIYFLTDVPQIPEN